MPIIVKRTEKFAPLYNLPPDIHILICIGGRGGMKTYEVSKFIAVKSTTEKKRCVIVRDEQTRIKESILNEIWARYDTANKNGQLDKFYSKNETELKDKVTSNTLIYTKGFRASTNSKQANLKGDSDIDIAVIEEAEDIRDVEKFNTFADSLRKSGSLIIIMLNTPDLGHWICKRYFTAQATEHDGYFKLIPRNIPGFACIQTSYTDNPFLPAHIVANYEGYGDPSSHLYNPHYYYTAILGYASTGRKGQIFTKFKPITLADYLALPFREVYGQDFGTASPAATIGVKFDGNSCYARLIDYKPKDVLTIGKLYSTLKFTSADRIICDYAEPNSISRLSNGWRDLDVKEYQLYPELSRGFYAVPCPSKDISAGISLLSGMNVYVVEGGEAWEEINNYCYAQDKYGNYVNEPIDDFNHCFVGSTNIQTSIGSKTMIDVNVGDMILTSNGYKKVLIKWDNGEKQTFNYCLQFDTFCVNLQCTKNHLIKTTEGWVKIDKLSVNHSIYLNSTSTGMNIHYIPEKSIFQEDVKDCTLRYGNQQTVKFQKGFMFIILTKIRLITNLIILKSRKLINIFLPILNNELRIIKNGIKNLQLKVLRLQKNGINHRMASSGIGNTERSAGKIDLIKSLNVNFVMENLKQGRQPEQNTAIKTVKLKRVEKGKSKTCNVYDLTIEDSHEYFANGVLVHNCLDALRYVAADQRGLTEMKAY